MLLTVLVGERGWQTSACSLLSGSWIIGSILSDVSRYEPPSALLMFPLWAVGVPVVPVDVLPCPPTEAEIPQPTHSSSSTSSSPSAFCVIQ